MGYGSWQVRGAVAVDESDSEVADGDQGGVRGEDDE